MATHPMPRFFLAFAGSNAQPLFKIEDDDADDVGIEQASDLRLALFEIALELDVLLGASNGALVAVRDSGLGLDPASLEHLFDAFYTTKSSGMGMGLSICRSIIEAHGGRIWAEANVPQGATFQFTLPWQAAS